MLRDHLYLRKTNVRNLGEAQDRGLVESHPDEGGREDLSVHLAALMEQFGLYFNIYQYQSYDYIIMSGSRCTSRS